MSGTWSGTYWVAPYRTFKHLAKCTSATNRNSIKLLVTSNFLDAWSIRYLTLLSSSASAKISSTSCHYNIQTTHTQCHQTAQLSATRQSLVSDPCRLQWVNEWVRDVPWRRPVTCCEWVNEWVNECTVEKTSDLLCSSFACICSRQRTTPSIFVEWSP